MASSGPSSPPPPPGRVVQTYANHAHRPVAWAIVWLICLLAVVAALWAAFRDRTLVAHVALLIAIGLLGTVSLLRVFVLRVQDRVIRLEMQVRLARLGLLREFEQLEHRQLIALRFASDAEMGPLVQRAITGKLTSKDIKQAVTNWQGDHFRT
jgi:hypothetical protein